MLTLTKQGGKQQNPYCCVINYWEEKMSARACSAGLRRVHHSHSHFKRFSVTHCLYSYRIPPQYYDRRIKCPSDKHFLNSQRGGGTAVRGYRPGSIGCLERL
jgi:hypothetical protein